jgi:hypothetical protein
LNLTGAALRLAASPTEAAACRQNDLLIQIDQPGGRLPG